MHVRERFLLCLIWGFAFTLGATSLPMVAAQESEQRRSEQRKVREREADRERDPKGEPITDRVGDPDLHRDRELQRDHEHRRMTLEFTLPEDRIGRALVERLVQELRQRFAGHERREQDQRFHAQHGPQPRDDHAPKDAARRNHIEQAIGHLEAAGLRELAQELRSQLHRPPSGRTMSVMLRDSAKRPGPRGEVEGHVGNLNERLDELQAMMRGLQEHTQKTSSIERSTEETRRDLERRARQFEERTDELENAVREVSDVTNERFEDLGRSIERRFDHLERDAKERIAEIEDILEDLEERLDEEDEHDDEDDD